jgi:hypothetical protein
LGTERERLIVTTDKDENIRNPAGGPMVRTAAVGTKLLLKDDSVVEIIGNPGDGGWLNVRYLQPATDEYVVDEEEWVFVVDVKDYA